MKLENQALLRDLPFPCSIIRTTRRKTISISIPHSGEVVVAAPRRAAESEIHCIVRKRIPWILKERARLLRFAPELLPKQFVSGETFYYLGQKYLLHVSQSSVTAVTLEDHLIKIQTPGHPAAPETAEGVRSQLLDWYRKAAEEHLMSRLRSLSSRFQRSPREIKIRNMKSRWGSCNSRGAIHLNWKLIMTPGAVIDYVIIHELCHLTEPNHSPKFWALVSNLLPDYFSRKKWLKQNELLFSNLS